MFSRDVTAAILVSQNNETAAMLISKPVLWELNTFNNNNNNNDNNNNNNYNLISNRFA